MSWQRGQCMAGGTPGSCRRSQPAGCARELPTGMQFNWHRWNLPGWRQPTAVGAIWPARCPSARPSAPVSSYSETIVTSEVSSKMLMKSFIMLGTTAASACGRGAVAVAIGLGRSILIICTSAWLVCFVIYIGALFTIDHDVHTLRSQMADRAKAITTG